MCSKNGTNNVKYWTKNDIFAKDKYLRCFIRDSNQKGHQYYEEKLKRTIQNGSRQQPPR